MVYRKTLLVLGCLVCFVCQLPAEDWPTFRGPLGNGISKDTGFPTEWGVDRTSSWKTALPGAGNGSPIVSSGKVFVTTATQDGTSRTLHCFDRKTGRELWKKSVEVSSEEVTHKTNPYAGTTPAADGERIAVWHGSAGLFCYDFSGKELWKQDLGKVATCGGYGSSPVIHNGKVFLNFGPGKTTFLIALDLKTGKELWKQDEPGGSDDKSPEWSVPGVLLSS